MPVWRMLKVQSWPLSFNRHLTTLDELKNLYWSRNAGGWDSSVTGPETMTLIVKRWNNCPNYALMCLLQGLGLNQQELEKHSGSSSAGLQNCIIADIVSLKHCPLSKFAGKIRTSLFFCLSTGVFGGCSLHKAAAGY